MAAVSICCDSLASPGLHVLICKVKGMIAGAPSLPGTEQSTVLVLLSTEHSLHKTGSLCPVADSQGDF
jgi:hypothetical protein